MQHIESMPGRTPRRDPDDTRPVTVSGTAIVRFSFNADITEDQWRQLHAADGAQLFGIANGDEPGSGLVTERTIECRGLDDIDIQDWEANG